MSYYCSDTHCTGSISIKLNEDKDYINNNITKCQNIKTIREHSLQYKEHNYARITEVINDLNYGSKQILIMININLYIFYQIIKKFLNKLNFNI